MPFVVTAALSIAAALAGASLALQQVVNAGLRDAVGSPWWAATTSYALGLLVTFCLALVLPGARPTGAIVARIPWVYWTGGLLGAIFIVTAILVVPRLGAASTLAVVVLGQMLGAIAFDRIGLLSLPQHTIGLSRIAGALCLVVGVALMRR